jgi:hypothetical protein
LRRTIIIGTALAVLSSAAVAYAASGFDTFTATATFKPAVAGSAGQPSPLSMSEHWTAKYTKGGNAAPLTKIVAKVYGLKYNGADFPKCTAAQINNAGTAKNWNAVCPKKSYIGGGPVQAELTASPSTGTPCDPYLKIYNGGPKTQTFFFTVNQQSPGGKYKCAGGAVSTGTGCAAYTGNLSYSGKDAVETINLPPCASTNAGNTGLYAALQKLDVTYLKLVTKKSGKTIGYEESVACSGNKRPYSFTFYAQNFKNSSPKTQETTIAHKAAC